jgi:hypothetical protein
MDGGKAWADVFGIEGNDTVRVMARRCRRHDVFKVDERKPDFTRPGRSLSTLPPRQIS